MAPDRSQDASPPCSASFAPESFEYKFRELCLDVCLISFQGSCGIYFKKKNHLNFFVSRLKVIFPGSSREAKEAHGGPCDGSAAQLVDTPLPSIVGQETLVFRCV